jgi:hypothetical protein
VLQEHFAESVGDKSISQQVCLQLHGCHFVAIELVPVVEVELQMRLQLDTLLHQVLLLLEVLDSVNHYDKVLVQIRCACILELNVWVDLPGFEEPAALVHHLLKEHADCKREHNHWDSTEVTKHIVVFSPQQGLNSKDDLAHAGRVNRAHKVELAAEAEFVERLLSLLDHVIHKGLISLPASLALRESESQVVQVVVDRQVVVPLCEVELDDIDDALKGHNNKLEQEVVYEVSHLDAVVFRHYRFLVEHPQEQHEER